MLALVISTLLPRIPSTVVRFTSPWLPVRIRCGKVCFGEVAIGPVFPWERAAPRERTRQTHAPGKLRLQRGSAIESRSILRPIVFGWRVRRSRDVFARHRSGGSRVCPAAGRPFRIFLRRSRDRGLGGSMVLASGFSTEALCFGDGSAVCHSAVLFAGQFGSRELLLCA